MLSRRSPCYGAKPVCVVAQCFLASEKFAAAAAAANAVMFLASPADDLETEGRWLFMLALTEPCFLAGGASRNRDPPPDGVVWWGGDSHKLFREPPPPPSKWWFIFNKWRASAPFPSETQQTQYKEDILAGTGSDHTSFIRMLRTFIRKQTLASFTVTERYEQIE